MIQRELYMKKVRPFIDKDIIKVMTGIADAESLLC